MNYYIQGNKGKAKQIKAAFEKLGYYTGTLGFTSSQLYYTIEGKVELMSFKALQNLIKTHPDYKELELPVESKFKVGDWLVYKNGNCFAGGFMEAQVVKVKDGVYFFASGTTCSFKFIDESCRLWTIEDAKDGDVLTNGKLIVIFNKLEEPDYKQHIIAYVGLDLCGRLQITEDTWQLGIDKAMPATKEQRDLLFQKINDAGYEWNEKKKELHKKPHYDISNFKPFDHCRFKPTETHDWIYADFWYVQAHYKVEHLSAIEKWES